MRHPDRIGGLTGFVSMFLALAVTAGMSFRTIPAIRDGGFVNPDSFMRLVRLGDILDRGRAIHDVARDGSGHGTMLHWTHLLDSLLVLLALPFEPFLTQRVSLHAAGVLFGPLCMAALAFAAVWAAAPFADRKWIWLAAVLPALSPAIVSYGLAGVVHHHVGVAIVSAAAWGWAARLVTRRADPHDGCSLGTWMAAGVWLTPETVPLTVLAFGGLAVAWILRPDRDDIPAAASLAGRAFASVTALALFADPPASGWDASEIDRLSVLFLGLAVACAGIGEGLRFAHRRCPAIRERIIAILVIGPLFTAVWAGLFWSALFPDTMDLSAGQIHAFFDPITEMRPVGGVSGWLTYLFTGLLAAMFLGGMAVKHRSWLLAYASVAAIVLIVIASRYVRFASNPELAGAVILPPAMTALSAALARWPSLIQSCARVALILLFVEVPYLGRMVSVTTAATAGPAAAGMGRDAGAPASDRDCRVSGGAALLASHDGAIVLTDANDTPEILYRTRVRTVGSLYHRDIPGFLRLRAAWRTRPSAAVPPEIEIAGIDLILICEAAGRSALVADLPPVTLYDQLQSGYPPQWLKPIGVDTASGYVVYAVSR